MPISTIRAATALLPEGWADEVRVGLGEDGRIAFVHRADGGGGSPDARTVRDDTGSAADHRVGVLLPGVVNAHGHAFQRAMAGLTEHRGAEPEDSFWSWRSLMYRFLERLGPDEVEAVAAFVQMEMLEAGYTASVEFHYLHHRPGGAPYENPAELSERIAAAAAASGIGLTLLPVHYRYGGCDRRPLQGGQRRFGTDPDRFETLWSRAADALGVLPADARIGVAPHSLRAIAADSLPALQAIAPEAPFHLHVAEQPAEVDEVLRNRGARPVEWLLANADVGPRWCLVHCTWMEPHETRDLARSGAVAGLCPITESNLGDGIFDAVAYLTQGGRIAVGSDSNVRIGLAEELRTLEYSQRLRDGSRAALATAERSTGRRLHDSVAAGGAQAAGRDSGRIEPGRWADLVALDSDHVDLDGRAGDTLLDSFVFAGAGSAVSEAWSAGRHLVRHGRHVARETIERRYRRAMRTLSAAL